MGRKQESWQRGIGAIVLVGGLLLGGSGVASAASPTSEEILAKVNEVLTAVGNIKEGNHTQRWDQNLPAAQRFVILSAFNNEAVLDKNTGLVWERYLSLDSRTWSNSDVSARAFCLTKVTGGQRGWRLPTIVELLSLSNPSVASPGPTLPPGHPFSNVLSATYWSASTDAEDPTQVWGMSFYNGIFFRLSKTLTGLAWCVRGGMQESAY